MKCRNYAHRGFSGKYPENTMLAFEKAVEAGCEGIELDVHFSKDQELVIIHDEKVDRTSDGNGYVKDFTYEELKKINFSYKFAEETGFQKIPTLKEYFEFVKDKDLITNIELKTGVFEYPGIEQAVYDLICKYGLKEKVIISSFNHYSIIRMKQIDPEIVCGFLSDTWILEAGSYLNKYHVEAYHPRFSMLTDEVMEDLREHKCAVNTWIVNKEKDIEEMIIKQVDGIISNYPDKVNKQLNRYHMR